ncbi:MULTISPECIES: hypothetical protein [Aeromonas]|uniref:hypothetical protein n=1 Tax=Aeromonas TaxID=642 RepID=UPI001D0B7ACC|nr:MULTISPECIES: hypothetical protein [Aeromonas]UDN24464.1 hypothetical protein LEO77_08105 [Aeromonas veronii]
MNTINGVILDDELEWTDEWDWTPMRQSVEYAVTGDFIAQQGLRKGGRPMTLTGRAKRSDLDALYLLLRTPEVMTLILFGQPHRVLWRHEEVPIQALPDMNVSNSADFPELGYTITLRLTEV